ncbi:MAG: type IV pilus assembly PilZ [Gallionellaceae bacterium]|nr:MAG: type IV pilus assembly PilZ [Gallionellaceae bacterium]
MTHSIEDSPYAIHSHKEIIFILDDMAKHKTLITLDTHDGVVLVTSVLYVSGDGKYVCIDVAADDSVNDRIVHSQHVSFVTQSDIKVRWYSTHLQLVAMPNGKYAFSMHVPSAIERVQRREYFRLDTLQGKHALICRIPTEGEIIEVPLFDMSVGGIGVTVRGELPAIFVQGEILEGCSIDFPEIGRVPISLRVRGKWSTISTLSGGHFHRIGLQFDNLGRGASNVIQRYMVQLEAEKISLT